MKSWTRSKYLWKFKFFWDDAKNAKKRCKCIKNVFFWIFNVFRYFWIFLKIYQNMGQKLGSNRCPLFTMLTKQNSSMFRIVSFVKKNSKCSFFFCVWSHRAISLNQNQNLRGWVNLRSRPAIPFNQNQYPVCCSPFLGPHKKIKIKSQRRLEK